MQYKHAEIIDFLKSIVQTPSVNGVHNEFDVAKKIVDFAIIHGLDFQVLSKETNHPNVIIKHNLDVLPKLLLIAHMDTVSPGQYEKWKYPPFGGEIVNGRLYGRGAVDNKGGIAASMACLLELKTFPAHIRESVALVCVPDEESGATGQLGLRYLLEKKIIHPCDAIYTYPGMERIIIGHRGVLRLKIITHGESIHSGSSKWQNKKAGCNAVTAMAEILLALENLEFRQPGIDDDFHGFHTTITPGTLIEGGTGVSIVPDKCTSLVDIRLIPTVTKKRILREIFRTVDKIAKQRKITRYNIIEETHIPPTIISSASKIVTVLQKVITNNYGKFPTTALSGPANESYILNENGFHTCVLGPEGGNVHSDNEYIKIPSIFKAAKIYTETSRMLLS